MGGRGHAFLHLISYGSSEVADYKHLEGGLKFVSAIPKSPSGKILRKDLRRELDWVIE